MSRRVCPRAESTAEAAGFHAAAMLPVSDAACAARIQQVAAQAIASLAARAGRP